VNAVEYLKVEKPPGKLFNSYNWGGYLIWALPEYPVFVDGRTDLYNDELIEQWMEIMNAKKGWQVLLARFGIGVILIENGSTLDRALQVERGWERIYKDPLAVIYKKR
jgi:hypothetical protein